MLVTTARGQGGWFCCRGRGVWSQSPGETADLCAGSMGVALYGTQSFENTFHAHVFFRIMVFALYFAIVTYNFLFIIFNFYLIFV